MADLAFLSPNGPNLQELAGALPRTHLNASFPKLSVIQGQHPYPLVTNLVLKTLVTLNIKVN